MNTGDTAFILLSAALVMLMTPGLALFYGGMVRRKNTLGTIMQSLIVIGLVSVEWLFIGYSLSFGPDVKGIIGDLSWFALRGVGLEPYPDYVATVPHQAFMIYQAMFAVITPALITGAFAERLKFSAFLVFVLLWSLLVYCPVAHWVWGVGGWIRNLGALDFAGGTVVHISSGVSALAAAIVMGRRIGFGEDPMQPHNISLSVLDRNIQWNQFLAEFGLEREQVEGVREEPQQDEPEPEHGHRVEEQAHDDGGELHLAPAAPGEDRSQEDPEEV